MKIAKKRVYPKKSIRRAFRKYDATLKELFHSLPDKLLELLTGKETKSLELLPVEFPAVSARRADLIMRLKDGNIYHLELQSGDDKQMPWRMLEYYFLIYRQYQQAPIQIVLYVGNKSTNINSRISLNNLEFGYRLVDIKQIEAGLLLESEKLSDNILAILCKVSNFRQTIRQILNKIMVLSQTDRTKALTQLLILAGLRAWKVITLEEFNSMPFTINIEDNWFLSDVFQQGEQKGLQKGLQEGRQEGQAIMLQHQLERKFATLPQSVIDRIHAADLATLESWSLRIFDVNSLDELFQ